MKYKKRFDNVIKLISEGDMNIVELCFGDIHIAEYCYSTNRKWLGLDINNKFVEYACKNGFTAEQKDIMTMEIPNNDVCIMVGSIYHFINDIEHVLKKMLVSSKKVIISEPIKNLSNNKYIGFFAKRSANVGQGMESFRFNESNFVELLDNHKERLSFNYKIISKDRDILVVLMPK
ncbi:hypothetical protein N9797_01800 [Gammaproteobacteria bacterium]|nr:hypothetical protein [Gammaproteobacteria bacterium]